MVTATTQHARRARRRVRAIAASVLDPELPVLTIEDLGILRDVTEDDQGAST